MSNNIKCLITYEENCDYNASKIVKDIEIPQQEVYIDIQKPQVININNRVGKNGNGEFYSSLIDTYYYNETLQITAITYPKTINSNGTIGHSNVPVKTGKLLFDYISLDNPNDITRITPNPIPIAENGLTTINFIPHYDGYIHVTYIGDSIYESSNNYYSGDDRLITLEKIPVYVTPNSDSIFIEPEKSINLTCNVTDIYGNKLNYGYVTFMGYHNLNPEALINPAEGMGVMLGNPVMVKNGVATLKYAYEQGLDIEYIHGSFNYHNDKYGNDFKYYTFHNNVIRVISISNNEFLTLNIAKIVDNNIDVSYDFDGFTHINTDDNLRIAYINNDNDFIFYDDMELIIHIDYTQYHIQQNFNAQRMETVEAYINEYVTFTNGTKEIKIVKDNGNGSDTFNYGDNIEIDDWAPGYYNIYITFKDNKNKENIDRKYYNDFKSNNFYVAVDYPEINLELDTIQCGDFTVQPNENFARKLKVSCNNAPSDLTGYFTINGKDYPASLNENNEFVVNSSVVKLQNVGNYSIIFTTNDFYDSNNKKYPSQTTIMPSENPYLKVRGDLEPIVKIPKGYVSNEYPGSIRFQMSIGNYFDDNINYYLLPRLYKNGTFEGNIGEKILYQGDMIEGVVEDLEVGKYQIILYLYQEDTFISSSDLSDMHEITPTLLESYIASPFNSNEEEVITGINTFIPFIIKSNKANISEYDISNLKVWLKHESDIKYIGYTVTEDMVSKSNNIININYNHSILKKGNWRIYISQNNDEPMIKPNDNNLGIIETGVYSFKGITIPAKIKFEINYVNESIDIDVTTQLNESINQLLLLQIKVSYGLGEEAIVYVLTHENGKIQLPLAACSNDLQSPRMQRQIFNIQATIDPYNDDLINDIKNDTFSNISSYYQNIYIEEETLLNNFIKQIKDLQYTTLFTTYSKTIKSENYELE